MATYCNDASFCFCLHCIYIEKFEDTKGAIRICISKKNRQHNGQKKKNKMTNNNQQNLHIKLRLSNTNPTKYGGELWCSGRESRSWSTSDNRCVNLVTNPWQVMIYFTMNFLLLLLSKLCVGRCSFLFCRSTTKSVRLLPKLLQYDPLLLDMSELSYRNNR
jgi:hypothetical protein